MAYLSPSPFSPLDLLLPTPHMNENFNFGNHSITCECHGPVLPESDSLDEAISHLEAASFHKFTGRLIKLAKDIYRAVAEETTENDEEELQALMRRRPRRMNRAWQYCASIERHAVDLFTGLESAVRDLTETKFEGMLSLGVPPQIIYNLQLTVMTLNRDVAEEVEGCMPRLLCLAAYQHDYFLFIDMIKLLDICAKGVKPATDYLVKGTGESARLANQLDDFLFRTTQSLSYAASSLHQWCIVVIHESYEESMDAGDQPMARVWADNSEATVNDEESNIARRDERRQNYQGTRMARNPRPTQPRKRHRSASPTGRDRAPMVHTCRPRHDRN